MKKILPFVIMIALLLCIPLSAWAEYSPYINDQADILTENQIQSLEQLAYDISYNCGMDVVIVTASSLNGQSSQVYADDYYDQHGYSENGILLLLAMFEREWYISTSGNAIKAFSDRELDALGDMMVSYFSDGDYYQGFRVFLTSLPDFAHAELSGATRSAGSIIVISLLIGLVAALIAIFIMRSAMNSKRSQNSAGKYLQNNSFRLHINQDIFLYSRVHKTQRQQQSSTGSKVHTSSSGRSHGGRGGKF